MEMIPTHSGKLRAIGYDAGKRLLQVTLENGSALEYANVSESLWRDFKASSSPWSYYRDHIEEEFTARPVSTKRTGSVKHPLDDLFKS